MSKRMAVCLSLGECPWSLSKTSLVLMCRWNRARHRLLGCSMGAVVSLGPGSGVFDSVFVLQGCSESGHHHDGPPEEDLEQHPGNEIPAAEHKRPQEASLTKSSAELHQAFLNTYPGKGAAGW